MRLHVGGEWGGNICMRCYQQCRNKCECDKRSAREEKKGERKRGGGKEKRRGKGGERGEGYGYRM